MAAVNDTRQVQMTVDLGGEQVKIERARFTDNLGQQFTLQIDVVSTLSEIDLLPHLGKPIAIHLYEDDELMRHFHGLIVSGEFRHDSGAGYHYRLEAKPFTYFLQNNCDMAIYQDITVPNIIKEVLGKAHQNDFRSDVSKEYQERVYCVQYRESDFDFITRLMEEEGIYYYWEHSADKHVFVMCDSPSAHAVAKPDSLTFNSSAASLHRAGSGDRGGGEYFLESWGERVETGGEALVTLRAFDFEKPESALETQAYDPLDHSNDDREVYHYPNRINVAQGLSQTLALNEMSALRCDRQLYAGRSQATSLACGTTVNVTDHFATRLDQRYLITRVEHVLQGEQYRAHDSTNQDEDGEATRVVIEAIPADTPFKLLEVTPKPVVQGLETAIVSGPAGEEIWTDKYGRVKVRFHWDRANTAGEKSTCWVRVAQFGGLGNIILPRIGQEVMVDFLHGNPDEPIVVGWVFNAKQMPVYPLPENKTRALWRTKSYKGGKSTKHCDQKLDTGDPGANELRFEDKSGQEEVFLHAEKDMNFRTRNNQTNHVANNQYEKVFWDRDAYVGRDETTTIKRNQTLTIKEGDQTETLEQGSRSVTIKQGNDELAVKMGNIKIKADMGKIEIEAGASITLTCGGSKITIDPIQVKIEATMITVEAQAILKTKGGAMAQHEGGGMNIVKGGIVMIN